MKEDQNIEWKESWRDEYLKWICGFANAQGGTLIIGRDDKGNVTGIEDAEKLLVDIPNKVRDTMGIVVDVNHRNENGLDMILKTAVSRRLAIDFRSFCGSGPVVFR